MSNSVAMPIFHPNGAPLTHTALNPPSETSRIDSFNLDDPDVLLQVRLGFRTVPNSTL